MQKITRCCPTCGQVVAKGNRDGSLVKDATLLPNVTAADYLISNPMFTQVFEQMSVAHKKRRGDDTHQLTP
jgi:hypothetical protein